MIICINCSPETKAKMDSLLGKDHYNNYSELLAIAVENLWILDREVGKKGVIIFNEESSLPATYPVPVSNNKATTINIEKPTHPSSNQNTVVSSPQASTDTAPTCIPDLFLSKGIDETAVFTTEIPSTGKTEATYTLDRWLFGQYNKLLPVKVNCRALVRLSAGKKGGVPLASTAAQIAEAAALMGDYLTDHDHRHQTCRDDALATAFPRSGPDTEKSRARYTNQFVGSVNSQNCLSGLLWDYRLVSLNSENGPFLHLTKQAVQLARLPNPILDGLQIDPAQKLSSDEMAFLLEHIRSFVPVETFAFRTLIQAIVRGADTPDTLQEALRTLIPTDSRRSLSPSFISSQRSGALSRMVDLGLIRRIRKGVKVTYAITSDGEAFVANSGYDTHEGDK